MIMGVDEAGRGPVIGPLVIASASCEGPGSLAEIGVKDSKMLTRDRRNDILVDLSRICGSAVMVIPAGAIDEARERMTMNRLEVLGFSSTIASHISGRPLVHDDLPEGIEVKVERGGNHIEEIILDAADVNENRFGKDIFENTVSILGDLGSRIRSYHKADRDFEIVGAASIFAKVTRDTIVERISEEIGYNVGSGYPSDVNTIRFISEWVKRKGTLPPECRTSWNTSKRILAANQQPTLFSFE